MDLFTVFPPQPGRTANTEEDSLRKSARTPGAPGLLMFSVVTAKGSNVCPKLGGEGHFIPMCPETLCVPAPVLGMGETQGALEGSIDWRKRKALIWLTLKDKGGLTSHGRVQPIGRLCNMVYLDLPLVHIFFHCCFFFFLCFC